MQDARGMAVLMLLWLVPFDKESNVSPGMRILLFFG
jgi:hypothetical protein